MKKLAIIGSSDLGHLAAHHAAQGKSYEVIGYYDDYKPKGAEVKGIKVLGGLNAIEEDYAKNIYDHLFIAIGYKHFDFRKTLYELMLKKGIPLATIIHPSCYVDSSCIIHPGNFLLPGCVLDMNVVLEGNVLLNTGCVIAHDSVVQSNSFLSPGVVVAGFVNIGASCFIGINTTIIDNVSICANTQTGGGTVVVKNIETPGLYVGNPARLIKKT